MQVCKDLKRVWLMLVFAVMTACICAGCKKKEAAPVPTVRSERLLEILRLLDMGQYEAALPKIEQYQELDETNTFLIDMLHVTVTNAAIATAEGLLRQGKFKEADDYIQSMIDRYGNLDGLVNAKNAFAAANQVHWQIAALKEPQTSDVLRQKAVSLEQDAKRLGSKKIAAFAVRKKAQVSVVRKIESDRAGFLIYADALDSAEKNNRPEVLTLLSLLSTNEAYSEESQRLYDSGIYCMKGVSGKK